MYAREIYCRAGNFICGKYLRFKSVMCKSGHFESESEPRYFESESIPFFLESESDSGFLALNPNLNPTGFGFVHH